MRGNEAHEDGVGRHRGLGRHRAEHQGFPRVSLAAFGSRKALITLGLAGCVGIAAVSTAVARSDNAPSTELTALTADRYDAAGAADRSMQRSASPSASPTSTAAVPSASPSPTPSPTVKTNPSPVAGLNKTQMNNAAIIVEVARSMNLPKRMMIIAVATGMQESNLYNNASGAVPESLNYPHEGSSIDHDSVGVFQQRPSSGWGTVKNLMNPRYQARNFLSALKRVDWRNMSLTQAAQAVQISAFPNAYAKHETRATTVVNAFF